MDKAYIREQDFHIATEDENEEINKRYKIKTRRTWLKFFFVSISLVVIGIIFQIIAHKISPWLHSKPGYYTKIYVVAAIIFGGFNLLSYIALKIKKKLEYNRDKTLVTKLKVRTKLRVDDLTVIRQQKFFIICEVDEGLMEDYVIVNSKTEFDNIKEGDMVYVKRSKDDGHYVYYCIA
ncbi:hypothetical protein [uncultured Eubacterium sp.]|uniref:hypothetical protein n=1 Tax=uncultured Eubacterium sp. TaxID=165185 RepID=UPI002595683E|nr:hypothetical protein [uncultured Eubacterium sp.]